MQFYETINYIGYDHDVSFEKKKITHSAAEPSSQSCSTSLQTVGEAEK